MKATPFADLSTLATHIRGVLAPPPPQLPKKFLLLYAYNGTGKTRLSTAFKNIGKKVDADGNVLERDTLYFNAFTEDLFHWDNDLENDIEPRLLVNPNSSLILGFKDLALSESIAKHFGRFCTARFEITLYSAEEVAEMAKPESPSHDLYRRFGSELETKPKYIRFKTQNGADWIKISRGEERIFIWSVFLAIVQQVLSGEGSFGWVKYLYIDDPISSLDEHNAIVVANHLIQLFRETPSKLMTVISTHHILFFNVLSNEIKNLLNTKDFPQYCLNRNRTGEGYNLYRQRSDTPFFHHVSSLVELYEAAQNDKIYTYHFNTLRSVLEKTAVFHGYGHFSACIKKSQNDADGILHQRFIDLLSHGKYSLYEPKEMGDETRDYFRTILYGFLERYPFNLDLFPPRPAVTAPVAAPATGAMT
jgi:hypothetical protein